MASANLYRLLHVDDPGAGELVIDARGQRQPAQVGPAPPSIVLINAGLLAVLRADLPGLKPGQIEQAARWAVEDQLARDAESQHVVALDRDASGQMVCLAIERSVLTRILAGLPVQAHRLVPDAACLPWKPGELVLTTSGSDVLVRWGRQDFDRLDSRAFAGLLPDLVSDCDDPAPRLICYGPPPAGLDPDLSIEQRNRPDNLLELLAPGGIDTPIDLLSGPFATGAGRGASRRWRIAAGLLAALLFGQVIHAGLEWQMLQREAASLDRNVHAQLLRVFPEIGRIERPRAQAERALNQLRYGRNAGLIELLGRAEPALAGADGVHIRSLDFRDGRLEVALSVADIADLEAIERRLRTATLAVRVQGLTLDQHGASGRLLIGADS